MAFFWFDDSYHQRADFALGAFVASLEDESPEVARINRITGVARAEGEFKSGSRMADNPAMRQSRDLLRQLITNRCRLLVTAVQFSQRDLLGRAALTLLRQAITSGVIPQGQHQAFFDQGIHVPSVDGFGMDGVVLHTSQDSRHVAGIQLADLAAHTLSMILLQHMGVQRKILDGVGPEWGYDEEAEIDLAFAMWAPLRYSFLSGGLPSVRAIQGNDDMFVTVEGYGLFVPPGASSALAVALRSAFGRSYLGCMH